jgi:ABC-type uncharacterized transport system permease subunit
MTDLSSHNLPYIESIQLNPNAVTVDLYTVYPRFIFSLLYLISPFIEMAAGSVDKEGSDESYAKLSLSARMVNQYFEKKINSS